MTHHCLHSNENPIYVFAEKELRGLSPNSHIHVFVSDLYVPMISPHIYLQQNRQTEYMAAQFLFWEYLFRIFDIVFAVCEQIVEK
jgi:hypothetical protein